MARRESPASDGGDDPPGHLPEPPARKTWDGTSLHAAYLGSDGDTAPARAPERGADPCVTVMDVVFSVLGEPFEQ